jgi:surface antigen
MFYIIKVLSIFLVFAIASTTSYAECYKDSRGSGNEVVGTLLGAAVGGLIGSQIGSGSGNKVAIGAGVLAGGLIGNNIGKKLDCRDIEYHNTTTQTSLEKQPTGTSSTWQNPDSGHSGVVTPTKTYVAQDGKPCRVFTQTIRVDGVAENVEATACRQDDGSWQIQEQY